MSDSRVGVVIVGIQDSGFEIRDSGLLSFDSETDEACGLDRLRFDVIDTRTAGAATNRTLESKHGFGIALCQGFHPTVGQVANEPVDAFQLRHFLGEIPEPYLLNPAPHQETPRDDHRPKNGRQIICRSGTDGPASLQRLATRTNVVWLGIRPQNESAEQSLHPVTAVG